MRVVVKVKVSSSRAGSSNSNCHGDGIGYRISSDGNLIINFAIANNFKINVSLVLNNILVFILVFVLHMNISKQRPFQETRWQRSLDIDHGSR